MSALRLSIFSILLFFFTLLMAPLEVSASQVRGYKILAIHSYHHGFEWTDGFHQGFVEQLRTLSPGSPLQVFSEYLDTKRRPATSEYMEFFQKYLEKKYTNFSPDLIFTSDDNAFRFMQQYGRQLFPKVPVAFCGVNNLKNEKFLSPIFQGVFERTPIKQNLNLITQLHPDLEQILVVGDGSPTNEAILNATLKQHHDDNYKTELKVFKDPSLPKAVEMLKEHKKGVVLLTTIGAFKNEYGQVSPPETTLKQLSGAGNFRIFVMASINMKPGAIGGWIKNSRTHGHAAGKIAFNMLTGTGVSETQAQTPPSDPTFDYQLLKSHGISIDSLPHNSRLLNEPTSLYYQYRYEILALIFLFTSLLITIMLLSINIARRKRAEGMLVENKEKLDYLFYHDALTGLPNRVLFQDRLEHALEMAKRHEISLAVLFLDLDRFKTINDSLGHKLGDQVLCTISKRLAEIISPTDTLARLGGDEFVIMVEDVNDIDKLVLLAQKLIKAVTPTIDIPQGEIFVTSSIGVALYPEDATTAQELMKLAEVALYNAKEKRNTYRFYRPEMDARATEFLFMESSLRKALERDQFVLHYQPQFDLEDGHLVGMEALLRWQHPEKGMVPPGDFIPLAEETGLIVPIGEWVLREACRQLKAWIDEGMSPIPVAVNISPPQFHLPTWSETVAEVLHNTSLDPALLELEITENLLMEDTEHAMKTMGALQRMGVSLSIDDFGAGYSSLAYLKQFPLKKLKIDRSFITDFKASPKDAAIVCTIIDLGWNLGLQILAEGIETESQLNFLKTRGCTLGQGFLLGRPMPASQMAKTMRDCSSLTEISA